MRNSIIVALRREYDALILVADGLLDMIYSHDACNVLTLSRMAAEAREAAHKSASMIERLLIGSPASAPKPSYEEESYIKRESAFKRAFTRLKEAILAFVA